MKKIIDGVLNVQAKDLVLIDPNAFISAADTDSLKAKLEEETWIVDYDTLSQVPIEYLYDYADYIESQIFTLEQVLNAIDERAKTESRDLTTQELEEKNVTIRQISRLQNQFEDIKTIYEEKELNHGKRRQ